MNTIQKMLETAKKYLKTTIAAAFTLGTAIVVWLNDLLPVLKGLLSSIK